MIFQVNLASVSCTSLGRYPRHDTLNGDDMPSINTVGPRNNSPAFKGSPSLKVNVLRSQMIVFNVILPLFKGNPEIKVKNLQSQWDR